MAVSTQVFVLVTIIAASIAGPVVEVVETDEYYGPIKKCPYGQSDEEFSACFTDRINSMRTMFANGIPEIGWPQLDPFQYEMFNITVELGPWTVSEIFKNIKLHHLSKFDDGKFKFNTTAKTLAFEIGAPLIRAEADWSFQTNVISLDRIIGNGDGWIEISGGKTRVALIMKLGHNSEGKRILQIDDALVLLDYDKSHTKLNGLLAPHPSLRQLGPSLMWFMNQYEKDIFQIIRHDLQRGVARVVKQVLNNVLTTIPFFAEYFVTD